MTLFHLSYLLLWLLAILLIPVSFVLVYLLAQLESQFRREGLGHGNNLIGRRLPTFGGIEAATGAAQRIDEVVRGQRYIILAVSAGCGSCASLIKELSSAQIGGISDIRILVLCMGEQGQCRSAMADLRSIPVYLLDARDDSTVDLWMVGFPAALFLDEFSIVADVRHPLTIRGLITAAENATIVSGEKATSTSAASISAGIG
jgi:hypothetical protein